MKRFFKHQSIVLCERFTAVMLSIQFRPNGHFEFEMRLRLRLLWDYYFLNKFQQKYFLENKMLQCQNSAFYKNGRVTD